MFRYVIHELFSDLLVIVPVSILLTLAFVAIVTYFDIEPIITWLYEDDE